VIRDLCRLYSRLYSLTAKDRPLPTSAAPASVGATPDSSHALLSLNVLLLLVLLLLVLLLLVLLLL
jgi:hypothetical protein